MNVAVCRISLRLTESHSLKTKRSVLGSLKARVRQRFNVSIAELGGQGSWQMATIGLCCVSNSVGHSTEALSEVVRFIEQEILGEAEMVECQTEVLAGLS